jgi:hypothetical protein
MAGPLRNLRWERFAREYASGESLASAYARAGFGGDDRWHRFNASRLSNKPPVRQRIDELMEQFAEASALKVEYLQAQLLPALRTNTQDLFEPGTDKLKSIADLPREVAAAIKAVKFDKKTGEVVEITLTDKVAAAGVLLRSVGAIKDAAITNNNVNANTTQLGDRLDRVMARLAADDQRLLSDELVEVERAKNDA